MKFLPLKGKALHISKTIYSSHTFSTQHHNYEDSKICAYLFLNSSKEILNEILTENSGDIANKARTKIRKAAKNHLIFYKTLTPIVYTSVEDSGVLLTMRYLCEPKKRRGKLETIWESILIEFEKHEDIELAYPTKRLINS